MNRIDRYKSKLEFIIDKITNLPQDLNQNEFLIDALFYRLQVSIDASMDVIAMLCKDLGITVKDDYHNLEELEKLNIFPLNLINELRRWNGLRNAVVHKYNKIEEQLIIDERKNVRKSLELFVKKTEEVINEKIFNNKRNKG